MMSEKHYKAIAEAIKTSSLKKYELPPLHMVSIDKDMLVRMLCVRFYKDNPNFDMRKFMDACVARS